MIGPPLLFYLLIFVLFDLKFSIYFRLSQLAGGRFPGEKGSDLAERERSLAPRRGAAVAQSPSGRKGKSKYLGPRVQLAIAVVRVQPADTDAGGRGALST